MEKKIRFETTSFSIETEAQRKFLMLMFNDYYTEVEADNCFVAVNENDEAVGYILCARNFDEYYKNFKRYKNFIFYIYLP